MTTATIPSNEAWERILDARGRIFRVTFRTKTPQRRMNPDGTRTQEIVAGPGRIRTMVARRLVQKFALGVIHPEERFQEDVEHNVLTVWDVQTFHLLRRHLEDQGMEPFAAMMTAGRRSYRRLNMDQIIDLQGV
jgi:hypothetical protein